MFCFASSTTMAVINLVIEAMGIAVSAFLASKNSPVRWSCTMAAAEQSFGAREVGTDPARRLTEEQNKNRPRTATTNLEAMPNLILSLIREVCVDFFHPTNGSAVNVANLKFPFHFFRNVGCGVIVHIVERILPNSFANLKDIRDAPLFRT
jgi:hypothetical protein